MGSRARRIRRFLKTSAAIAIAALVGLPDVVFAAKSLDQMSQPELDAFVQQLNETANWRKYRRPGDPPDFVPGQPVKVMHGAGASMGRAGRGGGGSFRRGGLANRRTAKSSRRNRDDSMAQSRGSSRANSSRSGLGSSSRSRGSSSSSFGSGGNSFGNSGSNSDPFSGFGE